MKLDSTQLNRTLPLTTDSGTVGKFQRRRSWAGWWGRWLTGVIAAGSVLGLNVLGLWQPLERPGYTLLFNFREHSGLLPNPGWDDRLAVIAIDEATLKHYGQFPLSRDLYADLLEQLAYVQPAAIGIDLLLTDPSPNDAQVGRGIYHNGNVVLAIDTSQPGPHPAIAPGIQQTAAGSFWVGHSNYSPDVDGISRRVSLYQGKTPALALALVDMYDLTTANTLTPQQSSVQIEALSSAKDAEGSEPGLENPGSRNSAAKHSGAKSTEEPWPSAFTINWPGRFEPHSLTERPLKTYSMADVLEGRVDLEVFRDQIVLIGLATSGTAGVRSPLNPEPPIPGVVFHAAIVDNVLNHRWLTPLPNWGLPPLLLGLGILASVSFGSQRLQTRTLVVLALSVGWVGVVVVAFAGNLWLPMVTPLATLLLTLVGGQVQKQWEGQQLMNLFAMYVAPEMANLIWQQRGELLHHGKMPAQELVATVMFIDIRGFTGIAETLSKQQLLDWLNRYFAALTACIMEHGGVVDKYIGDAVMAVFGVPFPRTSPEQIQQDAIAAVTTSLAIQKQIDLLNQTLPAEGIPIPPFKIGIGIHTGPVVAGSVGNHQRVNYSVFGDAVNIAARLEKLTKRLPAQLYNRVLMTDSTAQLVQAHCPTMAVGQLMLDGRQTATPLFTIAEAGLNPLQTTFDNQFGENPDRIASSTTAQG